MDFSYGLIYAGVAAAFWGGVLALGFRAVHTYREQRQLDRARDGELDERLSRLESDIAAIRRALDHGAAPAALPPAAHGGERVVEARQRELGA